MATARLSVRIGHVPPVASHAFDCVGATAAGMRAAFGQPAAASPRGYAHASDSALAALTKPPNPDMRGD